MDDTKGRVKRWWESLTIRAKKAVLRKRERTNEKARRRANPVRLVGGYVCHKCHTWYATAEERRACKQAHLPEAARAR